MIDKQALALAGIDLRSGLHYTGTQEIYESLLADFYETVAPRCEKLSAEYLSDDLKAYRREVHTLKSQARTIGATALAELAEALEAAAERQGSAFVREHTPELIAEYEKIGRAVSQYKTPPRAIGGRSAENGVLVELCVRLLTALDDFDIDRAGELMRAFFDYSVPESVAQKREELGSAVDNFFYERAIEITRAIMSEV